MCIVREENRTQKQVSQYIQTTHWMRYPHLWAKKTTMTNKKKQIQKVKENLSLKPEVNTEEVQKRRKATGRFLLIEEGRVQFLLWFSCCWFFFFHPFFPSPHSPLLSGNHQLVFCIDGFVVAFYLFGLALFFRFHKEAKSYGICLCLTYFT